MPTTCYITFDGNPAGVFYSGQTMSGKVFLATTKDKSIKGINITIKGHASVRWTEHRTRRRVRETRRFHARDDYFKSRVEVMQQPGGNSFNLPPGNYEYNFQIVLPTKLPSSFHGIHGVIKYQVVCTIERPWAFDNVFSQPFTVIAPIDLNLNPIYSRPLEAEVTKSISRILCCGNGGEIFIKATIPLTGFVPGQVLPVSVLIRNASRARCYETKTTLRQAVEYRSYSPYRKSRYVVKTLMRSAFEAVNKDEEKTFQANLCIPSVPPTSFNICNIIIISYYISVKVKTDGYHTNGELKLPITIGTVPCFYYQRPLNASEPSTSDQEALQSAPPSYEEAMALEPTYESDGEEDKHTKTSSYLPRYPVFNTPVEPPPEEIGGVVTTQPTETKERY